MIKILFDFPSVNGTPNSDSHKTLKALLSSLKRKVSTMKDSILDDLLWNGNAVTWGRLGYLCKKYFLKSGTPFGVPFTLGTFASQ